ncbi:LON peptidase substrate-binding domain-containing protein [Candidatus Sumerlaeota bacterium]|nr:LON peptidase substrate-binding domain-containing protein [Candidatus Sumerlaeota bacterium]
MSIQVPLLPLDGLVMFPGTVHRFHIFEQRHRLLVGNALQGERLITVALLRPGWEEQHFGSPPVHRIAGLGEITEVEPLSDGRSNIVVEGRHRVRLLRELSGSPHRVVDVEIVEETLRIEDRMTLQSEMRKMQRLGARLITLFPQFTPDLTELSFDASDASRTVDLIAHRCVRDVYDRQSILDESDICRRAQLARVQLMLLLQRFLSEADYGALMDSVERA